MICDFCKCVGCDKAMRDGLPGCLSLVCTKQHKGWGFHVAAGISCKGCADRIFNAYLNRRGI